MHCALRLIRITATRVLALSGGSLAAVAMLLFGRQMQTAQQMEIHGAAGGATAVPADTEHLAYIDMGDLGVGFGGGDPHPRPE